MRIASADLTGDGLDDLVIANSFDNTVTIAFQLPSGSFSPGTLTRPVGSSPASISFADLNGQVGPPDIMVAGQASGDVTLLFNDPDHTFANESRYRAGPGLFNIGTSPTAGTIVTSQPGDHRRPHHADPGKYAAQLLAVNPGTDSLSLLANLGGGSFAEASADTTYPLGDVSSIVQVQAGAFTPDTSDDLAILTTDAAGNSQVLIYLNKGDGTFAKPIIGAAGRAPPASPSSPPGQLRKLRSVRPSRPSRPCCSSATLTATSSRSPATARATSPSTAGA